MNPFGTMPVSDLFYIPREFLTDKNIEKAKKKKQEDVHIVLRPILAIAQCIAIMPLYGVFTDDPSKIRFVLRSLKSVLSIVAIVFSTMMTGLTFLRIRKEDVFSHRTVGDLLFYGASTFSMIYFFHLASKWKAIMDDWSKLDSYMSELKPTRASLRILFLAVLFMSMSVCEHLLANLETYMSKGHCDDPHSVKLFYINAFKHVFAFTEFRSWKGFLFSFINFMITMTWNFTDLFLMSISMAISSKFEKLNLELQSVRNKEKPLEYWHKTREIYNKISSLTKRLDVILSPIVLLSFTNNLYFICLQLLNSLKPMQSISKIVYFFLSFGHLLFRTIAVSMTASKIYDNSKAPLSALFSVSSDSYNDEVRRLIAQIAFDTVALTGGKFFYITRSFMLTLAGTIVTYEIVLVQFNALTGDGVNTEKPVLCS